MGDTGILASLADILSWVALSLGGFFYLVGAIGLNRMPDLFSRMHATSVSETLGAGLLILGMLLQAGFTLVAVKLIFILLVLLATAPVATHALARAALHNGERPLLADREGRLTPTDPVALFPELTEHLGEPLVSEQVEEGLPSDREEGAPSNS